jgi:very-short-patch-repair endonuclease
MEVNMMSNGPRMSGETRQIEASGYRVLRFWNNDVLGNIDGVLTEI